MKKRLFVLSVAFLILACSKEGWNKSSFMEVRLGTKVQDSLFVRGGNDHAAVFSFDSIIEPSNWRTYESFDEMVAACQIPEGVLHNLSTSELYGLCLNYPLGPCCFLYNDYQFGFDRIMRGFNGYSELKKRIIDRSISNTQIDQEDEFSSVYNRFKSFLDRDLFGEITTSDESVSSPERSTNITVLTYYGKSVTGKINNAQLSQQDSIEAYYVISKIFPNVTVLDSLTSDYNCHGYAWSMTSGSQTCWINRGDISIPSDVSNISKFWTNDAFTQTTVLADAVKIHYYDADHSAVKSSVSGYFESKWGKGYLVRHAPDYCPYSGGKHYYKHAPYMIQCVQGADISIPYGANRSYYLNPYPTGPNVTWSWDVESSKTGESVVGQYATITTNTSAGYPSVNIIISHAGEYEIICRFSNYYRTEEWRYQVFVEPDE